MPYGKDRILAEEYCWVITQEARRTCRGQSISSMRKFRLCLNSTQLTMSLLNVDLRALELTQIRFALDLPKRLCCVRLAASVLYWAGRTHSGLFRIVQTRHLGSINFLSNCCIQFATFYLVGIISFHTFPFHCHQELYNLLMPAILVCTLSLLFVPRLHIKALVVTCEHVGRCHVRISATTWLSWLRSCFAFVYQDTTLYDVITALLSFICSLL